jgi:hypothetical protein
MEQGKTGVESRKFQKLGITRFTAKDEGARESFSIVVVNEGNEAVDSVDVLGEFNGVKQRESFSLAAGEEKRVTFVFAKPESPGVYAGGFKARDSVSGASAEQPFQLEITQENEGGGAPIVVPSVSVSAGSVPQEYLVYGAAVVLAAAIVFGVVRARRARGLRGSSASKSSSSSSSSISSSSSFGSYSNSARKS